MPRAYPLDLRQGLIDAVEAGSSARAAPRRLQLGASMGVNRMQRKLQTGGVEAKPMHGHPPAKLAPHKERLLRLNVEWLTRIHGRCPIGVDPNDADGHGFRRH